MGPQTGAGGALQLRACQELMDRRILATIEGGWPLAYLDANVSEPGGPDRPAEFADIDAELRGRLAGELHQGEQILVALQGLGSAMVVTEERVIVLREGGQARPRTGIRTYTLDQIRGVDLVPPRFRAGRITLHLGELYWAGISMFFDGQLLATAEELRRVLRLQIARRRAQRRADHHQGRPRSA